MRQLLHERNDAEEVVMITRRREPSANHQGEASKDK